jgi:hypothetical protein
MKKLIFVIVILIIALPSVMAQKSQINRDDFNNTFKQISDSLPIGWTANSEAAYPDEIVLLSPLIDLEPDMTSNDPPELKGQCKIYILVQPRVSPDSIDIVRKRNHELRASLPPQNSKGNLTAWYEENAKTLKILDAEPTHYDYQYSYRIKCRRLPRGEAEKATYNEVMSYLNKMFLKYRE